MICYKDQTYCASPECVNACGRKLTDQVRDGAKRAGLPISQAYYCDEDGKVYQDTTASAAAPRETRKE